MRLSTNSIFGGPSLSDSATDEGCAGDGVIAWASVGRVSAVFRGGRDESDEG